MLTQGFPMSGFGYAPRPAATPYGAGGFHGNAQPAGGFGGPPPGIPSPPQFSGGGVQEPAPSGPMPGSPAALLMEQPSSPGGLPAAGPWGMGMPPAMGFPGMPPMAMAGGNMWSETPTAGGGGATGGGYFPGLGSPWGPIGGPPGGGFEFGAGPDRFGTGGLTPLPEGEETIQRPPITQPKRPKRRKVQRRKPRGNRQRFGNYEQDMLAENAPAMAQLPKKIQRRVARKRPSLTRKRRRD